MNYEAKAKELLTQMTLAEKASLCSGSNFWETKGVERLGIEKVMVTDGPHGLRKQAGSSDHLGINLSVPATCFPTAATTACSFDTNLLHEIGVALGEECLQENVAVILGPGANIKRSPLCGRNFEYFSEDPLLTGELCSSLINGIQSKGIGTSMKHFAVNNQESRRMVVDAIVDERALREIYLPAFETAVKKAQPWTIMCSYNQVNGEFASQNNKLLNEVLRDEWGFEGLVVTDWGAIVDRVKGIASGLDLEMPYAGPAHDDAIVKAVQEGFLDEAKLDTAVLHMLCLLPAAKDSAQEGYQYDVDTHHKLARKAATESSVLLKNEDNLLPLQRGSKLAVLGGFAENPRYQGAGSSRINPNRIENLCGVLTERGESFTYAPGYAANSDIVDEALLAEAESVAKLADIAMVCIGLPDSYESEGFDRDHLRLPQSHIALLQRIAAVNANTVVLLFGGSAMEMPWLSDAKSLLMLYLGGQAGASAAVDLLFGDAVPSGKLAESFPHKLEDNSSFHYFPGGEKTVEYRESIYVGYRYYDKASKDVLFPFGYGLSYTSFAYSGLTLEKKGDDVVASVLIKNIGGVTGREVVQFYVSQINASVFKPVRELAGFSKVELQPNEEKSVCITLSSRNFAYYDVDSKDFIVESGQYIVAAAASSRDIRCEISITLEGALPKGDAQPVAYETLNDGQFIVSAEEFASLYGNPLPPATHQSGDEYTINSTLGEIAVTNTGHAIIMQIQEQMAAMVNTEGDDTMGRMMQRMMGELPIRALSMFSGGAMSPQQIQEIVEAINNEVNPS